MAPPRTLEEFETHDLLEAVDHLDSIRSIVADGPNLKPSQIRIDLLKLHQLAMKVRNEGHGDVGGLMELAIEIEDQVAQMREASESIIEVLRGITESGIEQDETEDEKD